MATTTIQISTETARLLSARRIGGATYDEVILDLLEEEPPEEFFRELERRFREEPDIPLEVVRRQIGR